MRAEEVDRSAAPIGGDWQIPADESLAGRVFEFSAQVFVSRDGNIDRIELVEDAPLGPTMDKLLAALVLNRMQPALLQGRRVASVSTIAFRIEVQRDAF